MSALNDYRPARPTLLRERKAKAAQRRRKQPGERVARLRVDLNRLEVLSGWLKSNGMTTRTSPEDGSVRSRELGRFRLTVEARTRQGFVLPELLFITAMIAGMTVITIAFWPRTPGYLVLLGPAWLLVFTLFFMLPVRVVRGTLDADQVHAFVDVVNQIRFDQHLARISRYRRGVVDPRRAVYGALRAVGGETVVTFSEPAPLALWLRRRTKHRHRWAAADSASKVA